MKYPKDHALWNAVMQVLEEIGVEPEQVRVDYSGRGMYGDKCFGLMLDGLPDMLKVFAGLGLINETLDGELDDDIQRLAEAVRTDNMGRDTIYYFPGFEFEAAGE